MGVLDFAQSVGGGSLIGSVIGAAGSYINGKRSQDTAREQMAMQREFAQNGIRWRVADAKEAGIHPLAALGAQTVSYSPVTVGDDGLGSALQQMGQGISRAAEAKLLREERAEAQARQEMQDVFDMAFRQKQLEHMDLQNDVIRQQLKASQNVVTTTALPPSMPKVNGVKYEPDEVIIPDSGNPSATAGTHAAWTHVRNGPHVVPVLSSSNADAITENKEKSIGMEIGYAVGAYNGSIKRPESAYTEYEKKLLATGRFKDYYIPLLGWRVQPKVSLDNFFRFITGGFKGYNY